MRLKTERRNYYQLWLRCAD